MVGGGGSGVFGLMVGRGMMVVVWVEVLVGRKSDWGRGDEGGVMREEIRKHSGSEIGEEVKKK